MAERFVLTVDDATKDLINRQAEKYTEGNTSAYIRGAVVLHALMERQAVRGVDIPGWLTGLYDFEMLTELWKFVQLKRKELHEQLAKMDAERGKTRKKD